MQIDLIVLMLVCLIPGFKETNSPVKQSQTVVEVWCGGDDNLTQGVCHAVDSEFTSSPDFIVSNGEKPGVLIITIPTNVDWKQRGKKTRVFYKVEFTSNNDEKLGAKKGECWENDFKTCASQVIRHARIAARKLTTDH